MIKYFYLLAFTPQNQFIESSQYKSAFTLAEVLITLGIIGLVAALTLPSLISHNKMLESVNRLKKTYSVLNQAYKTAELNYGDITNWDWSLDSKDFFNKYFVPYLSITENCGNQASTVCWNDDGGIHTLNGQIRDMIQGTGYAKVKLSDGILLAFQNQNEDGHAHFYVDTNGKVGPNTYGKDIFMLTLTKGNVDDGLHKISHAGVWPYCSGLSNNRLKSTCNKSNTGTCCSAYLFANGWEIPKDYPGY